MRAFRARDTGLRRAPARLISPRSANSRSSSIDSRAIHTRPADSHNIRLQRRLRICNTLSGNIDFHSARPIDSFVTSPPAPPAPKR